VGILGVEAATNQACAALVPGPKLNPVFLFHQLRQSYESLRSLGRGGNQPNLNGELVKNFEVLVPPLDEQNRFVNIINSASKQADLSTFSLLNLEAIFSSLQSRAFSGQL
jgi:type I restriction enzyme S subunit